MSPHPARCFAFAASLLCFSLVSAPQLNAQTNTAQLSGLVMDNTGAVLPHSSVLIVNRDTGVSRSVQADQQGQYSAPALQPGHYRITVEAKGFQTLVTDNVTLNVAQEANLGFRLKIGAENQTITVDGSGQIINTMDASVSTVIDRKFVENIPLNGRSFQDLISMTPGVVTQSPQANSSIGNTGDFSVNGQRTESNQYLIDGISMTNNPGNGNAGSGGNGTLAASTALGTTQSLISVDALQEFRVESSSYSAEYGRSPGGQFSFATRSGTEHLHGSAFDYLRNNYFDANDWFNDHNGKAQTALRQNDFGGTLGGPVWFPGLNQAKDKTFFFTSYEGLRLTLPQAATVQYVPDTALRSNAAQVLQPLLGAYPIQNGKEEMVPCTQGATSTYPCPTGSATGTLVQSGLADFIEPYSLPSQLDSTSIRLDHTYGPRLSLFFRFGYTPSSVETRTLASVSKTNINTQTYTVGATSQLSRRLTNEFRIGYARNNGTLNVFLDSFGGATSINAAAQVGVGSYSNPEVLMYLTFSGVGTSLLSAYDSQTGSRNWNMVDTLSMSFGHHDMKAGINYNYLKNLRYSPDPLVEAFYYSGSTLETNKATALYVERVLNPTPIFTSTAAFVQDGWRLSRRVTLSTGLRWELAPAPHEQHGNDPYTLQGSLLNPSALTLAPQGTPLWNTYWFNLAPRLGVAWIPHAPSGWETVVRSGGGVFFDSENEAGGLAFNSFGFTGLQSYANGALPVTPAQLNFTPSVAAPYTSIYAFSPHLQLPYTLQWNTSVEQSLGKNQTVTISYVGANGRRLISTQSLSLRSMNPNLGTVYELPGNLTSNYQALETKFQRTVSHGVQALASYTWSHSIDYGSTYQAFGLTRGNSAFDVRNNVSGGVSWDIPDTPINSGIAKVLLDGWSTDGRLVARSGFPITLYGSLRLDSATGGYYYSGVNLVPGRPIYLYGSQYPGGRAINGGPNTTAATAAFATPTAGSAGNAPRNFVRGFGESQINLAMRREFHIKDAVGLQFRVEAFNLLNHPNFGYIDYILTDATFGQATKMLNQSLGTVAPQYQQGGPRSLQFALKLHF